MCIRDRCINVAVYINKHVDEIMWNEYKMMNLKKNYRNKKVDTYVNFAGSEVKKYVTKSKNSKYQLKCKLSNNTSLFGGYYFVNLKPNVGRKNLNYIYRGNAIVQIIVNDDGRIFSEIEKMLGSFRKNNNLQAGTRKCNLEEELEDYSGLDYEKIAQMEELYVLRKEKYNCDEGMKEIDSVFEWYETMEPDKFEEYDYHLEKEDEYFGFHEFNIDEDNDYILYDNKADDNFLYDDEEQHLKELLEPYLKAYED